MPRREVVFDDSFFDSLAAQVASERDGFGRPSRTDVLSLAIMPLMDALAEDYEGNTIEVPGDDLFRVLVQASNVVERIRLYTYELHDVVHVFEGEAIDPAAVARSIELSCTKYCSVGTTLAAGELEIHHGYVIRTPSGDEIYAEVLVTGPHASPTAVAAG